MVRYSLLAVGLIFAYAVFRSGAGLGEDWYFCGALLGIVGLVHGLLTPTRKMAPPPAPAFWFLLSALLALCCLQIVPLPISVLRIVSPPRAGLEEPLAAVVGAVESATLSVAPAASLRYLVVLLGCTVAFFLARNIAWRAKGRLWSVLAPFVGIAFLQALLGLLQRYWAGNALADGTYVNRNHFAGLLEMAVPFTVMGAVASLKRYDADEGRAMVQAAKACGLLAVTAALLAAIVQSLSRMGFISALAGLLVVGVMWFATASPSGNGRLWAGAAAVVIILAFLFLPTASLIQRFADLASTEEISANTRVQIWRETWQLVQAYPWVGVGLGGYESAFIAYKTVAPLYLVDFAHNDYLQYLAELGVIGFALLAILAARTVTQAFRAAVSAADIGERCFAIAATASFAAMALHSFVDFNLYVPAHMMMIAWIAGAVDQMSPGRAALGGPGAKPLWRSTPVQTEAKQEHPVPLALKLAGAVRST